MASGGDNPTVLVTGASGFVATHLVQQLIEGGYKVRGTVRSLKNEAKVKPVRDLGTPENPVELYEADLNDESSWLPAIKGCEFVHHVASAFPLAVPVSEDELIRPAVDGVVSVLKACRAYGGVKRVILTSSIAAINGIYSCRENPWTEEDWTDTDKLAVPRDAYIKSKALAEKAAWDFMRELPDDEKFELAVIVPGYIVGPPLCGVLTTSMEIPKRIIQKEIPALPKVGLAVVDVRDVAKAHVNAMTNPLAAGQRHILTTKSMWMKDFALIFKEEFSSQGYSIPTAELPNPVTRMASWVMKDLRSIIPGLGCLPSFDSSRMNNILGIPGRDPKSSLIEMAYAMIEAGHIKKTAKYTGPKSSE